MDLVSTFFARCCYHAGRKKNKQEKECILYRSQTIIINLSRIPWAIKIVCTDRCTKDVFDCRMQFRKDIVVLFKRFFTSVPTTTTTLPLVDRDARGDKEWCKRIGGWCFGFSRHLHCNLQKFPAQRSYILFFCSCTF